MEKTTECTTEITNHIDPKRHTTHHTEKLDAIYFLSQFQLDKMNLPRLSKPTEDGRTKKNDNANCEKRIQEQIDVVLS